MNIDELSVQAGKSKRTIQRWIAAYNKTNDTSFDNGARAVIEDPDLLSYLKSKFEPQPTLFEPSATIDQPIEQSIVKEKKPDTPKKRSVVSLQQRLSADWLVMTVLAVILLMDVFVFGAIGQHEFGEKVPVAWLFFGVIGFATGIGSISTYNRIKNSTTAEFWKYLFSVMQLLVFMLTMNEVWFWAEVTMSLMVVTVFTGTQRAIKN